MAEALPITT